MKLMKWYLIFVLFLLLIVIIIYVGLVVFILKVGFLMKLVIIVREDLNKKEKFYYIVIGDLLIEGVGD